MGTGRIRPLEWKRANGDAPGDSLQEAAETPGVAGSDVWQISIHDGGPSWNWFRCAASGEVIDIGSGSTPDECKRQIDTIRSVQFPHRRYSAAGVGLYVAGVLVLAGLVTFALWP